MMGFFPFSLRPLYPQHGDQMRDKSVGTDHFMAEHDRLKTNKLVTARKMRQSDSAVDALEWMHLIGQIVELVL